MIHHSGRFKPLGEANNPNNGQILSQPILDEIMFPILEWPYLGVSNFWKNRYISMGPHSGWFKPY